MKRYQIGLGALLIVALAAVGCAKKSTEQASIQGTGFDASSTSEELAQLPQANTNSNTNQQVGVEALPVEASPVTQGAPATAGQGAISSSTANTATSEKSSGALNHEQKIQTALKNAGFYTGSIDGKIGPASKRAIEAFQKNNNLKVDGKVGPKTWAALEAYLNGRTGSGESAAAAATTSTDSQ